MAGRVVPVLRHTAVRAPAEGQAQAGAQEHEGQENQGGKGKGGEQGMTAASAGRRRAAAPGVDFGGAVSAAHANSSQPPAELHGCAECHASSRFCVVLAGAAVQAARAYSRAAACSEPADAAALLDVASGELEDAALYYELAASAVRLCHETALRRCRNGDGAGRAEPARFRQAVRTAYHAVRGLYADEVEKRQRR